MADAIRHRGPDDGGTWTDPAAGIALAHRRLAIIDLSAAGHQPMQSSCGRYVLCFNGEIYNFADLRADLEAGGDVDWRGHSDTEVLLAAIRRWGLMIAMQRAEGMFALALWDRQDRILRLARDRLGEKPLYYGWQHRRSGPVFLFGSELKALRRHPAFVGGVDRAILPAYLRHGYVPAPATIHPGLSKLLPGQILTIGSDDSAPRTTNYWSLRDVATRGHRAIFTGSREDAAAEVEHLLAAAVRRQAVSDVPLGAFLSGGIDSSAVVALLQASSDRPIQTFTIGFGEVGYDEAPYARSIAAHLGTDHHEWRVTADAARDVIPDLPGIWCEPFADSSQLPTLLVSRMARRHVTVALSGDGGDEIFAGYQRYVMTDRLWRRLAWMSGGARRAFGRLGATIPPAWLNRIGCKAGLDFALGDRLNKAAALIDAESVEALYWRMVSAQQRPSTWIAGVEEPPSRIMALWQQMDPLDPVSRMMAVDSQSYLPDDILVKVDRAAMSVGLETRVPMLDRALVEFAWTLPLDYKLHDGLSKWPLRRLLQRHVPSALFERPKMGFAIPLAEWLRGPLRPWVEDMLAPDRLAHEGYWQPERVRAAWTQHRSGQGGLAPALWAVLMFQAWLDRYQDR
jgi:asparagine synthase (glutamine-hydrolysing)